MEKMQDRQHIYPDDIVIGLVSPLGTNVDKVQSFFEALLSNFKYELTPVHISKDVFNLFPEEAGRKSVAADTYADISSKIKRGNDICEKSLNKAILAVGAAAHIQYLRRTPPDPEKYRARAYFIRTLKRPEEVAELRKIYNKCFYLFSIYAEKAQRVKYLVQKKSMSEHSALELINKDENEDAEYGQKVSDVFHQADFFLADENNNSKIKSSISRCIDVIFGTPHATPTFNEFAMFMAFGAAVRSADLSRQVGAIIAQHGEIISLGANDCPAAGGGLYWPGQKGNRIEDHPNGRDYMRGYDSNDKQKRVIAEHITDLITKQVKSLDKEVVFKAILSNSYLKDLTEYGRVVHAEMEALLACSRQSVSCLGGTMYCTTFPCHNCAKHIIAAGIKEVVYVEPYPKSKAIEFHDEVIAQNPENGSNHASSASVNFRPFIGIGPRLFFELFSLKLSSGRKILRKDKLGHAAHWKRLEAVPRLTTPPISTEEFELACIDDVQKNAQLMQQQMDTVNSRNGVIDEK